MPGSGGWITADNVNEFFDADGAWRGRGLGPGAGIVRERDDDDVGNGAGGSGTEHGAEESKWQRTE
jgi:nucleotide-sensitive chloride channel 1A